jgi:hypothetical protein
MAGVPAGLTACRPAFVSATILAWASLPWRFQRTGCSRSWPRPARRVSASATCRRNGWSTAPSRWRCTWVPATLALDVVPALQPGMLCLADRYFFRYALWRKAAATGADLLWRVRSNLRLPRTAVLEDGYHLSVVYPSEKNPPRATNGVRVRGVEYRLQDVADAEPLYRLVTAILNEAQAPATDLAALYHECWEIEGALAELKTHLRGARIVLRSKTPDLVRQEFWGLLLAHFAVRGLMHEAALRSDEDPDTLATLGAGRLSFLHAVRVVRRKLPLLAAFPPLSTGSPCMRKCWTRSWRSAWRVPEAGRCRAGSSAR